MYIITFHGVALHHYGQGAYGWGPVSSITGARGVLVEFELREEAQDWIDKRDVFARGAVVHELT